MQTRSIAKGTFFGFAAIAVLFVILYVLLSCYNRPSADDFYFLGAVERQGIWNAALTAYNTWITRWSTLLFVGVMAKLFDASHSLFPFHLLTLFMLAIATGILLEKILRASYPEINNRILILYSFLFVAAFFMLSFSAGETWFWFTSVCMYLWPLIAFVFGIGFLSGPAEKKFPAVLLILCFLFIGGGSEVVALEAMLFLGLLIWRPSWFKSHFKISPGKKRIVAALLALIISLFIAWIGPGRLARQEALSDTTLANRFLLSVQSSGYFLLTQLPLKIHWFVFFMLPWIVLKKKLAPQEIKPVTVVFRSIAFDLLIFLVFVAVHFTITVFLLHSFPPFRTWITLSFGLAVFCAVTGWRLGELVLSSPQLKFITAIFIVACGILFIYNISTQAEMAKNYSMACDRRMELLKKVGGDEKMILELDPLPPSGMLYSAEISTDTGYFTNKHLREYAGTKVYLRKRPE